MPKFLVPFGLLATLLIACVVVHAIAKYRLQTHCKLIPVKKKIIKITKPGKKMEDKIS